MDQHSEGQTRRKISGDVEWDAYHHCRSLRRDSHLLILEIFFSVSLRAGHCVSQKRSASSSSYAVAEFVLNSIGSFGVV